MQNNARMAGSLKMFRQRCAERTRANMHPRQMTFRTLAESINHPNPEEVDDRVHKTIPSISLGAVYRNIRTFVQAGLLKEVALGYQPLRLDPNLANHHHQICRCCKSITDIVAEDVEPVRLKGELPNGFRVESCEISMHGLCAACTVKLARKEPLDGKSSQGGSRASGR